MKVNLIVKYAKYAGRWNNGSGYMEWAGQLVDSIDEAKDQVSDTTWTNVDVVEANITPGARNTYTVSKIVATRQQGRGWSDTRQITASTAGVK